jgi:hypothetical protein
MLKVRGGKLSCERIRAGTGDRVIEADFLRRKAAKFGGPRDHGCTRADPKLCKNPSQVRAYSPGTDIQYYGNDLIRVALGDHAHDF